MAGFLSLQRHVVYVLTAAGLFGASTPLAKLLLERMSSVQLAALAYCGGLALGIAWLIRRARTARAAPVKHSKWTAREFASLAGAIVAGGVLAPVILFWSLSAMPAASASLLLSFEGILTAAFAAVLFREAVHRRVWLAMLAPRSRYCSVNR